MNVDKYESYRRDVNFIKRYMKAVNAASGSEVDANSNVATKNIATMAPEIHKKDNIYSNRLYMHDRIKEMYGEELAEEYLRQLEDHELYRHDETLPIGTPYTYAAQESVVVYIDSSPYVMSLEQLYDACDVPEVLVDAENEVYQKYPQNIKIVDRDGLTNIEALTKKKRHRDLVIVKTKYGENVIVTDNHPMIISDEVTETIDAKDCLGKSQYRIPYNQVAPVNAHQISSIDVGTGKKYHHYELLQCGTQTYHSLHEYHIDENLGFFIGFFIAEGWYKETKQGGYHMMIKAKGETDLQRCADALYLSTGITAHIGEYTDSRGFKTLTVTHPDFVRYCKEVLDLGMTAHEKRLPRSILQYSESFINGLVSGLVDGDGTYHSGRFLIRLASRTCISQLATVLHAIGVPVSMSYYDSSNREGAMIQSCYPMFSVEFPAYDRFCMSRKYREDEQQKFSKYEESGFIEVNDVIPVENEYFLKDNDFIYDITTQSHTFVMNCLWVHNCASITLYPFLVKGMAGVGGTSKPPKHLRSFLGGFINLVFAVSSEICGACATPEFLSYFDYFVRKEYGDEYYTNPQKVINSMSGETIDDIIVQGFEQVVYSLNQPAGARGFQSVNKKTRL